MKKIIIAALVSSVLAGCGGSDGGSKPSIPTPDVDQPLIPLEPSTPVEPDQPLIPLEPSIPVVPDQPLIPLEPSIPVEPDTVPPTDLLPSNTAPVVEDVPELMVNYNDSMTYQLVIKDDHSEQFHYSLEGGLKFVSVNKDGLIYITPEGGKEWIGTHKFKVIISDGSMSTETNEIIIKITMPATDLEPSIPVAPPTSDCGENGECLEDDGFDVNPLMALGLTSEQAEMFVAICSANLGLCVKESDEEFFITLENGRYYPLTKSFSLATHWENLSTATSSKEVVSSVLTFQDTSEQSHELLYLPDDNNDVWLVAPFEVDAVNFRFLSHANSMMHWKLEVKEVNNDEPLFYTLFVDMVVSSEASELLKILQTTFGENSVNNQIASQFDLTVEEVDQMCAGSICTAYPQGSLAVVYPEYTLDIWGTNSSIIFKSPVSVASQHYNSGINYKVNARVQAPDVSLDVKDPSAYTHKSEEENILIVYSSFDIEEKVIQAAETSSVLIVHGSIDYQDGMMQDFSQYTHIEDNLAFSLIKKAYK